VLELLDWLSLVMDRAFQIPGTEVPYGLNTLLMMVPVLGDVIPTLVSVAILAIGLRHYRVPRIVAARMMLNSGLDAALGWIPVFGDLFDLWFKADTRNVRLFMEYAGRDAESTPSTWRHWLVVGAAAAGLVLLVVLLVLGTISLVRLIAQGFGG
jgi:hypothetical protein